MRTELGKPQSSSQATLEGDIQKSSGEQWRKRVGRPIHGYVGVDYEIAWEVATDKAAELKNVAEAISDESDVSSTGS